MKGIIILELLITVEYCVLYRLLFNLNVSASYNMDSHQTGPYCFKAVELVFDISICMYMQQVTSVQDVLGCIFTAGKVS